MGWSAYLSSLLKQVSTHWLGPADKENCTTMNLCRAHQNIGSNSTHDTCIMPSHCSFIYTYTYSYTYMYIIISSYCYIKKAISLNYFISLIFCYTCVITVQFGKCTTSDAPTLAPVVSCWKSSKSAVWLRRCWPCGFMKTGQWSFSLYTAKLAFERVSIYANQWWDFLAREVSTGNYIKGAPKCPNMSKAPLASGIGSNSYPRAAFRAPDTQVYGLWCRDGGTNMASQGQRCSLFLSVSLAQPSRFFSYITLISTLSGSLQQLQLCTFLVGKKENTCEACSHETWNTVNSPSMFMYVHVVSRR